MPIAAHSSGKRLVGVSPGSALISRMYGRPSCHDEIGARVVAQPSSRCVESASICKRGARDRDRSARALRGGCRRARTWRRSRRIRGRRHDLDTGSASSNSTPHENSRPGRTLRPASSCAVSEIAIIARDHSSCVRTIETPALEPSLRGFTTSGRFSEPGSSGSVRRRNRTCPRRASAGLRRTAAFW
jgi:hypothetical protein